MTGAGTRPVRSSITACRRSDPRIGERDPGLDAPSIAAGYAPVSPMVGELLELDRGLALVVDRVADAEDGGGGVEQAARAGGQRGVDALGGHRDHGGPLVRVAAGDLGVAGVGGGHPPRLPDGGRAARHGHRGEVAAALEGGQAGGQELAAPDRAVGAVAGPVEGHPDHRAVLAVVGQAGGDVRVVVLDALAGPRRRARARTWWTGTPGAGRGPRPAGRCRTAGGSARCPR